MLLAFTNCNDDKPNDNKPINEDNSIYHKWNLVKVTNGLWPTYNFDEGEITWEFQQNDTLKVEIDNSVNFLPRNYPFSFSTREYLFSLNRDRILIYHSVYEYDFLVRGNTLIISNTKVGGPEIKATFSLSNDDEPASEDNSIYHKWDLVKVTNGFGPTDNFDEGKITWEFQQNNTLKVEIDSSVNSLPIRYQFSLPTGEYQFSLNGYRISIYNPVHEYEYDFSLYGNTLFISDKPEADGPEATFSLSKLE